MHSLDHIVFGSFTLDEGTKFVENILQAKLSEIGYHKDIISLDIASARIGYWLGKTFIKLGNKKSAQKFFGLSANYDYSFYGQLSLERLKINPSPRYVTKKDSKGFKINNQKDYGPP